MMLTYQPGEVVLVSFLFTGAATYKRRPGLVMLDIGDDDVIVARITSQIYQTNLDVEITEWHKAGLFKPSVVRLHKLNTLEKSLIERTLGKLESDDWQKVKLKIQ